MEASELFIVQKLKSFGSKEKAAILSSFFKCKKGEYGEGDKFLGIPVPMQRALVKQIGEIDFGEADKLLQNKYHECRLTALLLLVQMFNKSKDENIRHEIYKFYISHTAAINNWDLVDLSAPNIVGGYLFDKSRQQLYKFAKSKNLWEQRISIVSTYYFIKRNDLDDTIKIATQLLNHKHDLIHKAVGWMLREVGKQNYDCLYNYLTTNDLYKQMPRTTLRYAIEKYPQELRKKFLEGKI